MLMHLEMEITPSAMPILLVIPQTIGQLYKHESVRLTTKKWDVMDFTQVT